jgi:hypothetical protein
LFSPRRRAHEVYDRPREWYRNVIRVSTLLLPVSTTSALRASWVVSRAAVLQTLPLRAARLEQILTVLTGDIQAH